MISVNPTALQCREVTRRDIDGCGSSIRWEDHLASLEPRPAAPVFVDVGANKGYASVHFLQRWAQNVPSSRQWQQVLLAFVRGHGSRMSVCGACGACGAPSPPEHNRHNGVAHLLELTSTNRMLLRHAINATGQQDRMRVHDLAASNVTMPVSVKRAAFGLEVRTICEGGSSKICRGSKEPLEHIEAVSFEDFLRRAGLESVYHVHIDTEGWDPLVIEGMRPSLARRVVAILEFEYSGRGYWAPPERYTHPDPRDRRTLGHTLALLSSAGYECFWQGKRALLPASGACWKPEHEFHKWSNLVCVHEARHIRAMRELARS